MMAGRPCVAMMTATPHSSRFVVEERKLTLGRQYRLRGGEGKLLGYVAQRWMRIKEAWTVYTDESKATVAFEVRATKVFDFKANLEVRDAAGTLLGTLRRKGWASIVADKWEIAGPSGWIVGQLQEEAGRGVMRRMLTRLIPYVATIQAPDGKPVVQVRGRFQVWGDTYDIEVLDPGVDARLACLLVVVIDSLAAERGSLLDVTGFGG